ncbi:MAG: thermonuclease family protein [Pseudomonadota bacterium]|nr:thermonuclease family protein [Pseudomonadota bacterium]
MSIPPPPPGFTLDADPPRRASVAAKPEPRPSRSPARIPPPPAGFVLDDPEATDGDTVRDGDLRVRMVGVDAPELNQPGYLRDSSTVPIGRQAQERLQDTLDLGPVSLGPLAGQSWGRTVAPLDTGAGDAGLSMLRSGYGLAAPDYLKDDPERLSDYVTAERLARMNRQGMHGTFAQDSADYREDPGYVVPRETVAQFFDTPTPIAGLPADKEREYIALLQTGTVENINGFLSANGYETTRPEDLAAYVAKRDAGGNVTPSIGYEAAPQPMIDGGGEALGAGVRKYASGVLAGGLDELGAVVDTFGGTQGRENVFNSDRRLADIWANNQRQNASTLSYDQTNYPVASTVGELSGGLTSGFLMPWGAGARTVPQMAKVGAAWGGAGGFLSTDGTVTDRLKGAAIGAPLGAVFDPALGKGVEALAPLVARGVRAITGRSGNVTARAAGDAPTVRTEETQSEPLGGPGDVPPPPAGFVLDPPSSQAMASDTMPSLSTAASVPDFERARRLLDPTTWAQLMSSAANIQPRDMLPIPRNYVEGPQEAAAIDVGRFAEARTPNERTELERRTVVNWRGEDIPKVGPTDMVGWLRSRGGLRPDDGGELSAMGVNNAARRGLDFVGQETRFGPLVDPEGMSLDDAALEAWEAGFFPEHTDRPDVNTFLDALRDTYDGNSGRRFRLDDQPEIGAYYAVQRERFDLEQQRDAVGGPVWQDRSGSGDDAAPFAPPEAYDEWPSEAKGRVGNIDVSKLNSPQDISRALKNSYNAVGGFDAATRGRITQAETERLASELNMSPEKLLARRKGQAFNAEEALAARRILAKSSNELVNAARSIQRMDNPGEELLAEFRQKWMRHVAIQEQVSGMTAEAGRALQQFRQAADSREVRTDILNGLIRGGGGKDGLKDAAERLIEAVEMGPGKFNAMVEKAAKPTFRNKVGELYINFLLSNPPTHIVNMVSNSITAMAQIPEYATASIIGAGRKAVLGKAAKERITGSEVGARTFGLVQGTKEGMSLFARALRTGEADDFVSKVEGDEFKAIKGFKGELVRIPTRLLTAEDQIFKGIARRMELNAHAVRIANREGLKGDAREQRIAGLLADPTDDMLERSMDYGRYLTFQRKLTGFGAAISQASSSNLLAKVVVPFVRTPINLLKFATERSPAAPMLSEWRADFRAGGERRDLALAKVMLGTGLATLMYQAALDGRITGAVPSDPAKAKLLYADGWQPYSIKIGDRYVSYSRLDPLSTTVGVAADMATLGDGLSKRQADDKATMLVASIMGNLASKTWLSGVSSFTEALTDPGRHADAWWQRTVSAFAVPAGVAGVARAIDPVARRRETVGESIQARIPGMTDELLPRRDVFGEVVPLDSLGPDFLSPFWQTKTKNDPVVAEMLRIGKGVSAPGKQFTEDGERIDYAPETYDRYHEIAGRLTYNSLLGLIGSEQYRRMSDDARRGATKDAIKQARKAARSVLDDAGYALPSRGASTPLPASGRSPRVVAGQVPPPPPGFSVEGESAGVNIYRDLQEAIPGVRITSGYRSPEYQADMRRRGYRPAANSLHQDGSALDLTPPPGRSMQWLEAKVRQLYPNANVLNERDHIHGEFPGYYGAPPLGGARSAGISNPNAGIPPPPPGFVLD